MSPKQQHAAALNAAREIAETAKAEGRNLTADEVKSIDEHLAKADELKAQIDAMPGSIMDHPAFKVADGDDPTRRYLGTKAAAAHNIASAMSKSGGPTFGTKALVVAGDVYADVPLLSADPFAQPRPPVSLVDALPIGRVSASTFTYLRQTTRTNNAAPVAAGGTKPTSVYTLTQIDGKLHVIAHISEAFDEYMVADSGGVLRFLQAEMVAGLYTALEGQVLNGDGTGANLTGLKNTSGIQTQAWATDVFLTTRKAITDLETLGYAPRMFVMTPANWEAIETAAFTSGNYILNGTGGGQNLPVEPAARRLWGVPVVTSTQQQADVGFLLADGAVELVSDGQVKTVTTNAVSDDFTKNQLRMRTESRFEVAVTAPAGVVRLALTSGVVL